MKQSFIYQMENVVRKFGLIPSRQFDGQVVMKVQRRLLGFPYGDPVQVAHVVRGPEELGQGKLLVMATTDDADLLRTVKVIVGLVAHACEVPSQVVTRVTELEMPVPVPKEAPSFRQAS